MRKSKTIFFSYLQLSNVGCEIILRGTIAFLYRAYPQYNLCFVVSSYDSERDKKLLADLGNVEVVPMVGWKRYLRGVLVKTGLDLWFWTPRFASRHFRKADLLVSVGGDIYTMSGNALPGDWLGWERFATRHGIPSIMFGANMEKFEVLSAADRTALITHLRRFRLIAVRDTATQDYLAEHGVSGNTVFFPDPIFSLRPSCHFSTSPVRCIGLNVSPFLLSNFGRGVFERIAKIVEELVARGYTFKLIPHVYASDGNPQLHDPVALHRLYDLLPDGVQSSVSLYDGSMSLRDMAREISAVDLFIGARMHSCLNAVTQGKPTYFLSYSSKARTMVSWLRMGPLSDLPDRVGCGPAAEVTVEAIQSLIDAQEHGRVEAPVKVDFGTDIDASTVGQMIKKAMFFEAK